MMNCMKTLVVTSIVAALPAPLLAGDPVSLDDIVQIGVLPGWRTETGRHMAGIKIELAPGWKTYWRAPGDAGIPPQFDWAGSENLGSMRLHWPTPEVFDQNGMQSIGYHGDVVIPIEITPRDSGTQSIVLDGEMELGVCKDICIPVTADIDAVLGDLTDGSEEIRASLKDSPLSANQAGVESVTCTIEPIRDGLRVTATIAVPSAAEAEVAIMEFADRSIWVSPTETKRDGKYLFATSDLVPPAAKPFLLQRSDLRFTILAADRAIDIRGCKAG